MRVHCTKNCRVFTVVVHRALVCDEHTQEKAPPRSHACFLGIAAEERSSVFYQYTIAVAKARAYFVYTLAGLYPYVYRRWESIEEATSANAFASYFFVCVKDAGLTPSAYGVLKLRELTRLARRRARSFLSILVLRENTKTFPFFFTGLVSKPFVEGTALCRDAA